MHEWERLLDDARADAQAQARTRERWLQRQATESATFVGTLLDLAEADATLSLTLVGGRRHDGRVVGLGHDVAVLDDRGEHVVVRLEAVTLVRPHPGQRTGAASGDRLAALDLGFAEVLGRVAGEAPDVALVLVTGDVVAGSLPAVGTDVVTIRMAPGADGFAYSPVASIASVRFRSG